MCYRTKKRLKQFTDKSGMDDKIDDVTLTDRISIGSSNKYKRNKESFDSIHKLESDSRLLNDEECAKVKCDIDCNDSPPCNENAVSENPFSENAVSENAFSEDDVSEDDFSDNAVSDEECKDESDLELLNPSVNFAIMKTLIALKTKNSKIYDTKFSYFNDDLFDASNVTNDTTSSSTMRKANKSDMTDKTGKTDIIDNLTDKYFGPMDTLNNDDKFLRDYLLYEGWKNPMPKLSLEIQTSAETGKKLTDKQDGQVLSCSESENHLTATDDFERKTNFRFEEPGGTEIQKFTRQDFETSQKCHKVTRRKLARQQKRLQSCDVGKTVHDGNSQDDNSKQDNTNVPDSDHECENPKIDSIHMTNGGQQDEEPSVLSLLSNNNDEQNEVEWWLCDACNNPLQPGTSKYYCEECDFCLCRHCYKAAVIKHPHELSCERVLPHCVPPSAWQLNKKSPRSSSTKPLRVVTKGRKFGTMGVVTKGRKPVTKKTTLRRVTKKIGNVQTNRKDRGDSSTSQSMTNCYIKPKDNVCEIKSNIKDNARRHINSGRPLGMHVSYKHNGLKKSKIYVKPKRTALMKTKKQHGKQEM